MGAQFSSKTVKKLVPSAIIIFIAFGISLYARDNIAGTIAGASLVFVATLIYGILGDLTFHNMYQRLLRLRHADAE